MTEHTDDFASWGAAWKEQAEELDMESMLVRLGERRTMERVERVVFWCAALVYAVFGAQAALKADVPTAGAPGRDGTLPRGARGGVRKPT